MKPTNHGVWAAVNSLSAQQAGADHVCVQAIGETALTEERLLELLAPRRSR